MTSLQLGSICRALAPVHLLLRVQSWYIVSRVSFEGLCVFELWPCPFFIGDLIADKRSTQQTAMPALVNSLVNQITPSTALDVLHLLITSTARDYQLLPEMLHNFFYFTGFFYVSSLLIFKLFIQIMMGTT